MRRLWRTTRAWLPLLLCLLVSGCRTTEKAVDVRTEYVYQFQRDSIYIDCTDTVYWMQKGDTVTIREKQVVREYYYTIYRDTLRTSDTLIREKVVQAAVSAEKPIKRWRWFFSGACVAFIVIFAAKIIIKIYLKK